MLTPLANPMDDTFTKFGGELDHAELFASGASSEDDPFNDSAGDLIEKMLAEDARNNESSDAGMNVTGNNSFNVQSILDSGLDKAGDSLDLTKEMDALIQPQKVEPLHHAEGAMGGGDAVMDIGGGRHHEASGIKKPEKTNMDWLLSPGSDVNGSSVPNQPLDAMLDAAPLNISLGGGPLDGNNRAKGRKKGLSTSHAVMPSPKLGVVRKANTNASRVRSAKSEGMLARALKAKYNSSSQLGKYNVNAATATAVINAKLSQSAARLGGRGPSNSALVQVLSKNSMFKGPSTTVENVDAMDDEGARGGKNATWGANPAPRRQGASLFSNLLSAPSAPSLNGVTSNNRSNPMQGKMTGTPLSMQDLLRGSKKQSKTQSLLRQSSAHSLLKQTSSQHLKGATRRADLASLLPPQHAAMAHSNSSGSIKASLRQTSSQPMPPTQPSNQVGNLGLLHESCRLYPTTAAVVESALRMDPEAVRKAVPVPVENGLSNKPQKVYGYPVNVAISHGGSFEVIKMLVDAAPDVLVQKDGTDGSGSLGIALMNKCGIPLVDMLVKANHQCVEIADRRGNYPLHVAVSSGASLAIVKRLHHLYPKAVLMRNFHSQTPLDIAQQSTLCPELVTNYLQAATFSPLENRVQHMQPSGGSQWEDGLDDIMETNF